jgi:flagellar basal-body rod protein FlgC
MDLLKAMEICATGLNAQRTIMNTTSMNLANAQTTRTAEGGPYRRKQVILSAAPIPPEFSSLLANKLNQAVSGVDVKEIIVDMSELGNRYDPSHPDADEFGYVWLPNVNALEEMVTLLEAVRGYEANVTAFNAAKGMILKALEIGR